MTVWTWLLFGTAAAIVVALIVGFALWVEDRAITRACESLGDDFDESDTWDWRTHRP